MSKDLQKTDNSVSEQEQAKHKLPEEGFYVSKDGLTIREVVGFEPAENNRDGKTYYVVYNESKNLSCTDWYLGYKTYVVEWNGDYHHRKWIKLDVPLEDYLAEGEKIIEGEVDMSDYDIVETPANETAALVGRDTKQTMLSRQADLEKKQTRLALMERAVSREMEKRRRQLEIIRKDFENKLKVFEREIKKVMRIIDSIELYLGMHEDLFQLQSGEPTDKDEPIQFRQQILYMDEEVQTLTRSGFGMDFRDIHLFDEWLVKDKNYEKVLPEKKGVVVFRPRRKYREYSSVDRKKDAEMNNANRETYFLIRNGDNIYRIHSNIRVDDRLFPLRKELEELMEKYGEIMSKQSEYDKDKVKDEADDFMYKFQKRAIFLQGLIDRTAVFHPAHEKLNIFNMDECQDKVNFIYDDEVALPTGRLSFDEWKYELNRKITRGSRIVHSGSYTDGSYHIPRADYAYRFRPMRDRNVPTLPKEGIYSVEEIWETKQDDLPYYVLENLDKIDWIRNVEVTSTEYKGYSKGYENYKTNKWGWHRTGLEPQEVRTEHTTEYGGDDIIPSSRCNFEERKLIIRYNPKDDVHIGWSWETRERKNRLTFIIKPFEDHFVLNYDAITIEDIDFYLTSRTDRHRYHTMIPLLIEIRAQKVKELADEKEFVRLMLGEMDKAGIGSAKDGRTLEEHAWDAVDWWKMKVIEKRPLTKDDAKAYRMIKGRLTSGNAIRKWFKKKKK